MRTARAPPQRPPPAAVYSDRDGEAEPPSACEHAEVVGPGCRAHPRGTSHPVDAVVNEGSRPPRDERELILWSSPPAKGDIEMRNRWLSACCLGRPVAMNQVEQSGIVLGLRSTAEQRRSIEVVLVVVALGCPTLFADAMVAVTGNAPDWQS